jgi:ATP-dependent DNA helicase PIF1
MKRAREDVDVLIQKLKEKRLQQAEQSTMHLKLPEKIKWTYELKQLWNLLSNNQFTLVSGIAGTGKSVLLNSLRLLLENHTDFVQHVLAPTGVAASNVKGITIHHWMGLGLASDPIGKILSFIRSGRAVQCIKVVGGSHILLIDEISMVDPDFFEKMAKICSAVTNTPGPFGKIKIVFFGDFLQLPPITDSDMNYVFQTDTWKSMKVARMYLRHVYRQSDPSFLRLLREVRLGKCSKQSMDILENRVEEPDGVYTRLCSYRSTVDSFNKKKLAGIDTEPSTLEGIITIRNRAECKTINKNDLKCAERIVSQIDKHFPVPSRLVLKVGAQVMCRTNHIPSLCNGSIGIVTAISTTHVSVIFGDGVLFNLQPVSLYYKVGHTAMVELKQFPLTLAWAMSIHKSQGMTIDRAYIDMNCFEYGQFYVAISRVRTLEGLYLSSKNFKCIKAHPKAIIFEEDNVLISLLLGIKYSKDSAVSKVFSSSMIADKQCLRLIMLFL